MVISEMKILESNVKASVKWIMLIVPYHVLIPTVWPNAHVLLLNVIMVNVEYYWPFDCIYFASDCPCNEHCPNGCLDCPNPICVCGENSSPQNKDNLETCKKEKSIDLGQCIIDCGSDQACENSCVELFKAEYGECPCQVSFRITLINLTFLLDGMSVWLSLWCFPLLTRQKICVGFKYS